MKASPGARERKARETCGVCGRGFARSQMVPVDAIRPQVAGEIERRSADWRKTGFVCQDEIAAARHAHVQALLTAERGELDALDQTVIDSLARHETTVGNVEAMFQANIGFGDRLADRVAQFGGSWTFILGFAGVIIVWIAFNLVALFAVDRFDPYPFILLNLALSCVAAFQAPLIMMSQRRQEAKDRLRAQNDYKVNLRAELEIRQLHEKLDHVLLHQWERLTEIQQVQLEIMEDLARARRR